MNYLALIKDDSIESRYTKLAYETIVKDLLEDNKHGIARARDLEFWEGEEVYKRYGLFVPGNFYVFRYAGPEVEQNGLKWHDRVPIMLALGVGKDKDSGKKYVYGVNFNLLTVPVRAALLQELDTIGRSFFEDQLFRDLAKGKVSFSQQLVKALQPDEGLKFLTVVTRKYKISQKTWAFRKYYVDKITRCRLIDTWQWKYLPFLDYSQGVRGAQLARIQKDNINK